MTEMTREEMLALIAKQGALIDQMKKDNQRKLTCKVSEKGAVSFYGIRRMPITLYIEELDKILEDGSEELLVQRLIEQDELDKEEARQSASIAIQFAMESIAKLRVLKAQLEAKAQEVEDNG